MRILLQAISYLALTLLLVATITYLAGNIDKPLLHRMMLTATVAWFGTCPFWIGKKA